jgi:hypothetical protein
MTAARKLLTIVDTVILGGECTKISTLLVKGK